MTECWRCGRAVDERSASAKAYVFGVVCGRRECRQVRMMLSKCDERFWFRASLPARGGGGRPASYTMDGDRNYQQAMSDPGLNRSMEIDAETGRGSYA